MYVERLDIYRNDTTARLASILPDYIVERGSAGSRDLCVTLRTLSPDKLTHTHEITLLTCYEEEEYSVKT